LRRRASGPCATALLPRAAPPHSTPPPSGFAASPRRADLGHRQLRRRASGPCATALLPRATPPHSTPPPSGFPAPPRANLGPRQLRAPRERPLRHCTPPPSGSTTLHSSVDRLLLLPLCCLRVVAARARPGDDRRAPATAPSWPVAPAPAMVWGNAALPLPVGAWANGSRGRSPSGFDDPPRFLSIRPLTGATTLIPSGPRRSACAATLGKLGRLRTCFEAPHRWLRPDRASSATTSRAARRAPRFVSAVGSTPTRRLERPAPQAWSSPGSIAERLACTMSEIQGNIGLR
jgi:hypothetical protein